MPYSHRDWVSGQSVDVLSIQENGLHFEAPAELGQKTGWFYDHRESRLSLRRWVKNKRVLDLYTYLGAFGLNAASAGASSVLAIDASAVAVDAANKNAVLNNHADTFVAKCADAVNASMLLF